MFLMRALAVLKAVLNSGFCIRPFSAISTDLIAGGCLARFARQLESESGHSMRRARVAVASIARARLPDRTWSSQIDDRLDCEMIVRLLSDQGRTVLALRNAGYGWSEIGQLLNGSVVTIKGSFCREIEQIREKLKLAGVSRKAR
jgi:hypothetical protein